jgi:hypothetical protein
MIRSILTLTACALLSACLPQKDVSDLLSDYVNDINRYQGLDVDLPSVRFLEHKLPPYRLRQQVLEVFDLGLIDFLSLQQCELGFLVGNKNSILGKVMPNSQRFLYEVRVIEALNECASGSISLQQKLKRVAIVKQAELNKAYANVLFNSKETDVFFSLSNGYLPLSENVSGFHELRTSLSVLAQLGSMIEEGDSAAAILDSGLLDGFEAHLQIINNSEYAGRLILSLTLLTDYLNSISKGLSVLETDSAFCRGPMVFLKQKFKSHYVERLQPYLARLNSPAYDVLLSLMRIQKSAALPTIELNHFLQQFSIDDEGGIWQTYQKSVRDHAYQWNRLLRACHLF